MTTFCRFAPNLALGLALGLALALTLTASPALAASGPPPGFVLTDNADLAFTSPDGATRLEQYMKDSEDLFGVKWQVWARRGDQMTELKPEQGYGAGFRFTSDSQWLVRMQKTGSGSQDLFSIMSRTAPSSARRNNHSAISPGPISTAVPTRRR
ncbi:hypothetical protein GGD66_002888 [Bradyrhizobium sp. CIR48]|nr:hypothetical protein [Bradyrhizobium sp. CIR48]